MEVTPQHLTLTDEACASGDATFKVNPPLRPRSDVDALRRGVADGVVDAIATDHAPHPPAAKAAPFAEAPPGMLGLETALGVVLTDLVAPGLLDPIRALALLSWRPAAIAGLVDHGRPVAPGEPANLAVIDPRRSWTVEGSPPGQPRPQHALRRAPPRRPGPPHDAGGRGGRRRRGRPPLKPRRR